jgi:transketolase
VRTAFIEELVRAAAVDQRIWLLTGDLGFSVLEPFSDRYPDRFINVGVAEQNMVGIAAGLAMTGKLVFLYSIANFSTLRCLEQLRNDVCYHNLPVIAVAVGGGLAYGSLGYSHHAVEDLAIMRSLPNISVVAPGDPHETRAAVKALIALNRPGYLRLGKANEKIVHKIEPTIAPNRVNVLRTGFDVSLVSTGGALTLAMEAADQLNLHRVSAEVLSLPFVAPLSSKAVLDVALRTGKIVTIEEHVSGGLGAAFAERLCNLGIGAQLRTITLQPVSQGCAGSQDYLRKAQGLTVERVVEAAKILAESRQSAAA